MRTASNPYIAYGVGRSGDVVHVDCWDAYADRHTTFDAQGRPNVKVMQATLFLPAALKDSLRGRSCSQCGQRFAVHPMIPKFKLSH